MGKAQGNQNFATSQEQNAVNANNAQSSYTSATQDIGEFKNELGKYASQNPYKQGGEFQTSQNQQLADTAAGGAQSTAQAIQGSQVRSGQNPAAGIAAAEQVSQANQRNMTSSENQATQQRIQGETGYNTNTLNASAKPEEMQAGLYGQAGEQATKDLGTGAEVAVGSKWHLM